MEQKADVVLDLEGNAIEGASVEVWAGIGNAQVDYKTPAAVYDQNGNILPNSTVTTGPQGDFAFSVPNGKYVLRVLVRGTVYKTIGPLTFYDPADDSNRLSSISIAGNLTPDANNQDESVAKLQTNSESSSTALNSPIQSLLNAYTRLKKLVSNAQQKLAESVSVSDFYVAGEPNQTNMIQRALNASVGRRLFFPAATYVTTGNEVPSNSHLVFERGAVLRLANGANRPALQNVNFKKTTWGGAVYGLDSNIIIEGLYLDGNQANQVHTGSGTYAEEYTSGIRFGGVTNLVLRDITIYQARTFGIWVYSIYDLIAHDIRFDQYMAGPPDNQDGLHVNGPATNLDIRNIRGSTNDDMIALNADDAYFGTNFTTGPITNAIIDGVFPTACLNGIRLLSATSRMDQVIVKNIVGSTRDVAVNQSPYGLGAGNVGSLTIENIDVRCSNPFQPRTSNYYAVISLEGIIESVSLRNIKNHRPADNRPTILIPASANIGNLVISGLTLMETGDSSINGFHPVWVQGYVDTMTVRDVQYFRDSLLTPSGNLIYINAPGKGVVNLSCSGWVVERLIEPITLANGFLTNVSLTGIDDRNGYAGSALLSLSSLTSTVTNVDMSNCTTATNRRLISQAGLSGLGARATIDKAGASGASVIMNANQTIAAGGYTKLAFNTEVFDRLGEYDTSTLGFTVTQGPGVYLVNASVDITVPTNPTDSVLALYKNGALSRALSVKRLIGDDTLIGSALINVQPGEIYDVRLYTSTATTTKNSAGTIVFYERFK